MLFNSVRCGFHQSIRLHNSQTHRAFTDTRHRSIWCIRYTHHFENKVIAYTCQQINKQKGRMYVYFKLQINIDNMNIQ